MQAPAGESLYGAVVNYIGQPISEIDTPENRKLVKAHKVCGGVWGVGGRGGAGCVGVGGLCV